MQDTATRFWSRVDRKGVNDCWNWTGAVGDDGYGSFNMDGKKVRSHRVAYQLVKGELHKGLFVCHSCDNPLCCNPQHLWLGSPMENVRDKIKKGRGGKPWSMVSLDQAKEIREGFHYYHISTKKMAKHYGISCGSIHDIATMKSYRHDHLLCGAPAQVFVLGEKYGVNLCAEHAKSWDLPVITKFISSEDATCCFVK